MNIGLFGFRLYDQHLGVYMRRWILQTPIGFLRLHNIREPDKDDALHDHPWHFAALILRGGYTEQRPVPGGCPAWGPFQTARYDAGSVNLCRADSVHRISKVHGDSGAWTLVVSGRRVRGFGFWTKPAPNASRVPGGAVFTPWQEWTSAEEKGWNAEDYAARLREVGASE